MATSSAIRFEAPSKSGSRVSSRHTTAHTHARQHRDILPPFAIYVLSFRVMKQC